MGEIKTGRLYLTKAFEKIHFDTHPLIFELKIHMPRFIRIEFPHVEQMLVSVLVTQGFHLLGFIGALRLTTAIKEPVVDMIATGFYGENVVHLHLAGLNAASVIYRVIDTLGLHRDRPAGRVELLDNAVTDGAHVFHVRRDRIVRRGEPLPLDKEKRCVPAGAEIVRDHVPIERHFDGHDVGMHMEIGECAVFDEHLSASAPQYRRVRIGIVHRAEID